MVKYVIQLYDDPRDQRGIVPPYVYFEKYRGEEIEALSTYERSRDDAIKAFVKSCKGISATVGKPWEEQICVISVRKFFEASLEVLKKTVSELSLADYSTDNGVMDSLKHLVGCGLNPYDWYVLYDRTIYHPDEFMRQHGEPGCIFYVGNLYTAKI